MYFFYTGVVPSLKSPAKLDPEKGSNSEKADFERAIELTGKKNNYIDKKESK